jgi:hypothetical protein
MACWEPVFVAVVGGSERERALFLRGLVAALRVRGTSATRLEGGEAPRRKGASPGDRSPFWEMDVVFVEGFAGSPLPRIVLSTEDEPLPDAALTSGDVIAVVTPPVRSASILDRIALDVSSRTAAARQHAAPA